MKYFIDDYGTVIFVEKDEGLYKKTMEALESEQRLEFIQAFGRAADECGLVDGELAAIATAQMRGKLKGLVVIICSNTDYDKDSMFKETRMDKVVKEIENEYDNMMSFDGAEIEEMLDTIMGMKDGAMDFISKNPDLFAGANADWIKKEVKNAKLMYRIPARDIFKLKDYAEYFLYGPKESYIKARPGVVLDDFYDRAEKTVYEEHFQKINIR